MNLLEHYIIDVINIEVLQTPEQIKDEYLGVIVFCDCWGDRRVVKHLTTREAWERDLRLGYFMA